MTSFPPIPRAQWNHDPDLLQYAGCCAVTTCRGRVFKFEVVTPHIEAGRISGFIGPAHIVGRRICKRMCDWTREVAKRCCGETNLGILEYDVETDNGRLEKRVVNINEISDIEAALDNDCRIYNHLTLTCSRLGMPLTWINKMYIPTAAAFEVASEIVGIDELSSTGEISSELEELRAAWNDPTGLDVETTAEQGRVLASRWPGNVALEEYMTHVRNACVAIDKQRKTGYIHMMSEDYAPGAGKYHSSFWRAAWVAHRGCKQMEVTESCVICARHRVARQQGELAERVHRKLAASEQGKLAAAVQDELAAAVQDKRDERAAVRVQDKRDELAARVQDKLAAAAQQYRAGILKEMLKWEVFHNQAE